MEKHNTIIFGENKITLKYETETLIFEKQRNPEYVKGAEFIDRKGDRFFLTKRKS